MEVSIINKRWTEDHPGLMMRAECHQIEVLLITIKWMMVNSRK
jgi:hypothetical protein